MSVLGFAAFGSSVSVRGRARVAGSFSVFDFVRLGSSISVRSFVRIGSTLSCANTPLLACRLSIGQYVHLGSSLSVRSPARMRGSSLSVFDFLHLGLGVSTRSFSRVGSTVSMYSYGAVGSCLSIRSFSRLGSSVSTAGTFAIKDTLKIGTFQVAYSASNYVQNDVAMPASTGAGGLQFTFTAASRHALMIEDTGVTAFGHLDGTWGCDAGNCITMTSDRRLKYHIHPLFKELATVAKKGDRREYLSLEDETFDKDADTLSVIQQLRPVGYKYKKAAESKYSRFGFVAQEMESLLPALTITDPRGYKLLHLKDLIAVLTLGLQSLDRVTDALDSEIASLDRRVDEDQSVLDPRINSVEEAFLQEIIGKMLEQSDISLIADDIEAAAAALIVRKIDEDQAEPTNEIKTIKTQQLDLRITQEVEITKNATMTRRTGSVDGADDPREDK